MTFPYELLIGLRYLRAKRRNQFISIISLFSMLGIGVGVMALIVVLSVMNGFQSELRNRILSVVSHVQIMGANGDMANWQSVVHEVKGTPHVVDAAPFIEEQGMLSFNQSVRGAMIRGVDPTLENRVANFAGHMVNGQLDVLQAGEFNIILGSELARALGVKTGDRVTLITPQGVVTPAGVLPRLKTFTVAAIFEVGMFEYDSGLALINLSDAQKLYRLDDQVSGVRLKLDDLFQARNVVNQLADTLSVHAYISDWMHSHANFFRAVQIEKNMMFIILSLIVAVAAFNLISTLVMAVTDKQADIAILRTLGARAPGILCVFVIQGALMGIAGLVLGVISGVSIALNIDTIVPWIEKVLGTELLAKDVYYISSLPSKLLWSDVGIIIAISLLLTFLATIYPSLRAAKINPAEALRYE